MSKKDDAGVRQEGASPSDAADARGQAFISISEAARRGYASRSTLQRAIKSGRISVSHDTGSDAVLQIAELERVFGGASGDTPPRDRIMTQAKGSKNMPLSVEVELLRQERDRLQADLEREREQAAEREAWMREQVEAQQRLLTDERTKSWWQRTFGRR